MKRFLIPIALFIVLIGFLAVGLKRDPREVPSPLVGKPAPTFSLPMLVGGQSLSPQDMRTRSVVDAMASEEAGHAAMARGLGGTELPRPVKLGMQLASRVMTRLSYWV